MFYNSYTYLSKYYVFQKLKKEKRKKKIIIFFLKHRNTLIIDGLELQTLLLLLPYKISPKQWNQQVNYKYQKEQYRKIHQGFN